MEQMLTATETTDDTENGAAAYDSSTAVECYSGRSWGKQVVVVVLGCCPQIAMMMKRWIVRERIRSQKSWWKSVGSPCKKLILGDSWWAKNNMQTPEQHLRCSSTSYDLMSFRWYSEI
jgi:hypothetical protein